MNRGRTRPVGAVNERWIPLWLILAAAPLIPYAWPLGQQALADTPLAYLVWIPPIGFAWAVAVLREHPPYNNDLETNFILGTGLLFIAGLVLAVGPVVWPYSFVGARLGLVLWPLWALGVTWLIFGVTVTPRLAAPLAYLALSWPAPAAWFLAPVQGLLTRITVGAAASATRPLHWIAPGGHGVFLVQHLGTAVPVLVNSACSGSDGVLAFTLVLPPLLTRFHGSLRSKAAFVLLGGALAFALNLLRLGLLLLAVHLLGIRWTFDVLHPSLGFVLFALLALILVRLALALQLTPGARTEPWANLKAPGIAAAAVALLASAAVVSSLMPLVYAGDVLPGTAVRVRSTSLGRIAPQMQGFRRVLVGRFDDTSILGAGSRSIAYAYSNPLGAYVLAQIYETPSLAALESYAYASCLAYHGDTTVATLPFVVSQGRVAEEYGVRLPPTRSGGSAAPVVDVEWTLSVRRRGETFFLRVTLSAPPEQARYWRRRYFAAYHPPRGLLAAGAVPARGEMPRKLATSARALRTFAAYYEAALISSAGD